MEIAKSKSVTYDCMLLSDKSTRQVEELLNSSNLLSKLEDLGIKVPEITMQENMHCTLRYMAGKRNEWKREYQLCNEELHKQASIAVKEIGAYVKDNILRNIGLYVDKNQCLCEGTNIPNEFFTNEINHITVAINNDKDDEGNPMAKPSETDRCFSDHVYKNPSNNEFTYTILLEDTIMLDATLEAIVGTEKVETLSDYPEMRAERERKEEEINEKDIEEYEPEI